MTDDRRAVDITEYRRMDSGEWLVRVRTPLGEYSEIAETADHALRDITTRYLRDASALAHQSDP